MRAPPHDRRRQFYKGGCARAVYGMCGSVSYRSTEEIWSPSGSALGFRELIKIKHSALGVSGLRLFHRLKLVHPGSLLRLMLNIFPRFLCHVLDRVEVSSDCEQLARSHTLS